MKNLAIFIDRDGVINKNKKYVHKIKNFEFYKDVFEAFLKIPKKYKKIIITNQAGIAKGIFKKTDYHKLTNWMIDEFKKQKIKIDKIYFCPHHPQGVIKKYTKKCKCRKPKIGMIKKAEKTFNLDLKKCWVIGDKLTDIMAGKKAECKTILVKTGYGGKDFQCKIKPDFIAKIFSKAISIINLHDN